MAFISKAVLTSPPQPLPTLMTLPVVGAVVLMLSEVGAKTEVSSTIIQKQIGNGTMKGMSMLFVAYFLRIIDYLLWLNPKTSPPKGPQSSFVWVAPTPSKTYPIVDQNGF